jgi:hypothetical protein
MLIAEACAGRGVSPQSAAPASSACRNPVGRGERPVVALVIAKASVFAKPRAPALVERDGPPRQAPRRSSKKRRTEPSAEGANQR